MQKTIVAMTFALGLFGGIALATGVYQATATESAHAGAAQTTLAGGAHMVGADRVAPASGHWIVSDSGTLTWVLDTDTRGKAPDAQWIADRERHIADLNREIDCQIYTCDAP